MIFAVCSNTISTISTISTITLKKVRVRKNILHR